VGGGEIEQVLSGRGRKEGGKLSTGDALKKYSGEGRKGNWGRLGGSSLGGEEIGT